MARIRRTDTEAPGWSRRGRGRGFEYRDERGRLITDEEKLGRIKALVIPPAWRRVWICPDPNGHLQVTGRDKAGRKQYLYHPKWRELRNRERFEGILDFVHLLPDVRRWVARDLKPKSLARDSVLACAVRLLDVGSFRIGGEEYAEQNETYGLATMLKEHAKLNGKAVIFDYPGKHSQQINVTIEDAAVHALVTRLKRRRSGGPELLAYKRSGRWHDVRSDDINAYIKGLTDERFSAKDFRTWNATLLAAVHLASAEPDGDREADVRNACESVAAVLGNTPAVCREAYIDPRLFDAYVGGRSIREAMDALDDKRRDLFAVREQLELAVIDLLGATARVR